jgi:cytochrome P450
MTQPAPRDADRLRDPATWQDPYPVYDELRLRSPVQLGRSSWILLSHEHARAALTDPERFSSNVRASDNPVFRESPLVFDDPPRHTQIRRIITKAFTPRRVADAEPWIRDIAADLLDAMGSGPSEFVTGFADPLPVFVIARMMGIPTDRFRDFKQWSEDRAYVTHHLRGQAEEDKSPELRSAEAGAKAITDWFASIVEDRRARPADDLISALVTAEVDGEHLSPADVVGTCCVLLSAGNLTTTRLLGNLVRMLADDPALYAAMRADRALIDPIVEECLRLESPVQTPIRRTTADVTLGDRTIPAGSFVTVGLGAANRDPLAFADVAQVDLDRSEPHLAFGHGIHYCLGAALARLEARVSLEALADRASRLELAEPPVRETGSLANRGHESLVLRFVA